jgi:ERCC4-related helicase
MKSITPSYTESLINFAATERAQKMGFATSQLHGATAAFNMLQRNGVAYLADEVGMGKTYVALGTMALLRFQNPSARILVIAPRENIQLKWIKEQQNFCRKNWQHVDNIVKTFGDVPARLPVSCGSIGEFASRLQEREHADLFLRATSFSIAASDPERRKRLRNDLLRRVPWIDKGLFSTRNPSRFRDMYGMVLNALVPDIDLLVVDEAHNFRHGFGEKVANRNRVLGMALGHPEIQDADCPWYRPRVKNLLLLSATPFENDYGDLYRQLNVFGKANAVLTDPESGQKHKVVHFLDADEGTQRRVAKSFLIRRTQYISIAGEELSKNQYRRDWREGGYEHFDNPIEISDAKQRLIVGLMQKKVTEVLGDERFQNSFQIGMLSSFESFMESIARKNKTKPAAVEVDQEAVFDGDQDATNHEKLGVDTYSLNHVVSSYRKRFNARLPHPKLDATASSLARVFSTGEKALVFVRRVATVRELRAKLAEIYDEQLKNRMVKRLPKLAPRIRELFLQYENEKLNERESESQEALDEEETRLEELMIGVEEDEGSVDTFFSWFFRGSGPKGVLSGAAFQKNRLSSYSSAYATIFEDNHVSLVLGRPSNIFSELCEKTGLDGVTAESELRSRGYAYFRNRSKQKTGYPRFYVLEAYQFAALSLLKEVGDEVGERSRIVLSEAYHDSEERILDVPRGFPDPRDSVNIATFFTELERRPLLHEKIWPHIQMEDFRESFRDRETKRVLIATAARLGASFIDLYFEAMEILGSFDLRSEADVKDPELALAKSFGDLLEKQMHEPLALNAFYELSEIAKSFDVLMDVNFPEARGAPLSELPTLFARSLQHQDPIGGMSGGVNKRTVKQFRMPGYPLVLATTDVLQEGEDLHTYCRNVIHYGVTWTPSAMEQRTGRVDRIHSLAQRELDGRETAAEPDELIQVHFPHLCDTVERLQVRTVLERLNRFLQLIHRDVDNPLHAETKIALDHDILRDSTMPPRIRKKLESDFPVQDKWLAGRLHHDEGSLRERALQLATQFDSVCERLGHNFDCKNKSANQKHVYNGSVFVNGGILSSSMGDVSQTGGRQQEFSVTLKGQFVQGGSLLRFKGPVDRIDLSDERIDELYHLHQDWLAASRLCIKPEKGGGLVSVEIDRIFDMKNTQFKEVASAFEQVVTLADVGRAELRGERQGQRDIDRVPSTEKDVAKLENYMSRILLERDESWRRDGPALLVPVGSHGRSQRLRMRCSEADVLLTTTILGAKDVTKSAKRWRELALLAWKRNTECDFVSFQFDRRNRLVGRITHPSRFLDYEEFETYVETLAIESDRFEYLLTGRDRW